MTVGVDDGLDRPERASAVALDRLTQLAGRVLDVPIVCASLVDAERQLLTSSYGLSTPTALLISWSFVKEVVASGRPLVVRDGRRHHLVAWNPAVRDGMVTAYVGMPLLASHGRAVGALSVMDRKPRRWSGPQLDLLRKVSARIVGVMEQGAWKSTTGRRAPARWPAIASLQEPGSPRAVPGLTPSARPPRNRFCSAVPDEASG